MSATKKTGRNAPCPCGSGFKYKKCCLPKEEQTATPVAQPEQQVFITNELKQLQEQASKKNAGFKLFGTLFFFTTEGGDAWLLELIDQDALKVASEGKDVQIKIEESEDYLEIGWTHSFKIDSGKLVTKAITDNALETIHNSPVTIIKDAQKKFLRKFSDQELKKIHAEARNS